MKSTLILDDTPMDYDSVTNEVSYGVYNKMIAENPDEYYKPRMKIFFKRDSVQHFSEPSIEGKQIEMLTAMKKIFDRDSTNYEIVISPLYDQVKLNPRDMRVLDSIFGKEKVHDYSGINWITNNKYNYYEESHYRPPITARILSEIYKKEEN